MPSLLISNTNNEPCNHGWIHADRIATIDYSTFRIPEPRQRKAASLKLTLQTADEFFNQGIQLIDQRSFSEATEAFFSSTQLQWIFTAAHIELGNAYSALRQYDKALEAHTNALGNDPASLIAHYNIL